MGIYVIATEGNGLAGMPIKVGITCGDPKNRLSTLQTGSPYRLSLFAFFPGEFYFSRNIEHLFSIAHREKRLNGEWYAISPQAAKAWIVNDLLQTAACFPSEMREEFLSEVGLLSEAQ